MRKALVSVFVAVVVLLILFSVSPAQAAGSGDPFSCAWVARQEKELQASLFNIECASVVPFDLPIKGDSRADYRVNTVLGVGGALNGPSVGNELFNPYRPGFLGDILNRK